MVSKRLIRSVFRREEIFNAGIEAMDINGENKHVYGFYFAKYMFTINMGRVETKNPERRLQTVAATQEIAGVCSEMANQTGRDNFKNHG